MLPWNFKVGTQRPWNIGHIKASDLLITPRGNVGAVGRSDLPLSPHAASLLNQRGQGDGGGMSGHLGIWLKLTDSEFLWSRVAVWSQPCLEPCRADLLVLSLP